jgi:two-component system chemotaxis response regulator CheB
VLVDLDLWSGGLETIERIMAVRATPIVVIGAAAEHPEAAIAAGAVDVIGGLDVAPGTADYAHMVVRHLKIASRVRVITHPRGRLRRRGLLAPPLDKPIATGARVEPALATFEPRASRAVMSTAADSAGPWRGRSANTAVPTRPYDPKRGPRIIAIGASTGGPPALATILSELPADLHAAVVIVQHMAEGFVEGLARWLDGICALPVVVAVPGERIQPGQVYLAPANQNLLVRPGYRIALEEPHDNQFHVPGVDVTFRTIAALSGPNAVGVLLTGMGRDGAAGLKAMRDCGAFTIGQDESTSVVWGMPAAAQQLDAVDLELPLPQVAAAVIAAVTPEPVAEGEPDAVTAGLS